VICLVIAAVNRVTCRITWGSFAILICVRCQNQTLSISFFSLSPLPCREFFRSKKKMSSTGSVAAPIESGVEVFDTTLFSAVCAELEDAKEVQPPTLVAVPGQDALLKKWTVTYFAAAVSLKFSSVKRIIDPSTSKTFWIWSRPRY
jgi:hypothetical protein